MRAVNQYFVGSNKETVAPPIPDVAVVGAAIGSSVRCNSGTYDPLTDRIYFAAWRYPGIIEFNYHDFSWTTVALPPGGATDHRLSGLVHTGELIIGIPLTNPYAVWFNPVTKETGHFGTFFSGSYKWYGGCLANNGFVYGTPWRGANRFLKIDPVNLTSELVGPTIGGGDRFSGSCLFTATQIMAANRNYPDPVVYNTDTDTVTFIDDLGGGVVNKFWSTQTTETNKVFVCKSNFNQHLRIEKSTLVAELFGTPSSVNQGFYGAGLAPNQRIYTTPASRNIIEVLDIDGGSALEIPTPITGSEKWLGSPILAPDGAFYFPPFQANQILRVANIGTVRSSMFEFPSSMIDFHLSDWNIYQNRY